MTHFQSHTHSFRPGALWPAFHCECWKGRVQHDPTQILTVYTTGICWVSSSTLVSGGPSVGDRVLPLNPGVGDIWVQATHFLSTECNIEAETPCEVGPWISVEQS